MKKLLSIILAGIMLLVASGTVLAQEKPILRVAINAEFAPFEYYDENGELAGFDIELMNYIGNLLGYEIQYEDMVFEGLLPCVKAGKVDCAISAISITEERQAYVDFSSPYLSCMATYPDSEGVHAVIQHYGIVILKDHQDDLYAQIEEGIQKAKETGLIDELAQKYNLEQVSDTTEYDYAFTAPADAVGGDPAETKNITVSNQGVYGGITVAVNGQNIDFQTKPFIDENSRTQIPVREFAESLGCSVYWSAEERQVSIVVDENGDRYQFIIGEPRYQKNSDYYDIDTAAQIVDNKTFIPLRCIAEMMGYTVGYNVPELSIFKICDKDGNIIIEDQDIASGKGEYVQIAPPMPGEVYHVILTFTDEGREKYKEATKRISQYPDGENYIAITINGKLVVESFIEEELDVHEFNISGRFTAGVENDFEEFFNFLFTDQ